MKKILLLLIVFFSVNVIAAEFKLFNSEPNLNEILDLESNVDKSVVSPYDVYGYDIFFNNFKYKTSPTLFLDVGFGDFIKIDVYNYCTGVLIHSEYKNSGASSGTISFSKQISCPGLKYYANIEYSIRGHYGNYYVEY